MCGAISRIQRPLISSLQTLTRKISLDRTTIHVHQSHPTPLYGRHLSPFHAFHNPQTHTLLSFFFLSFNVLLPHTHTDQFHSADFPFSRVQGLVFSPNSDCTPITVYCCETMSLFLSPFFFFFFLFFDIPLYAACWRYAFVVIASWFFARPLFEKRSRRSLLFFHIQRETLWRLDLPRVRGCQGNSA